MRLKTTTVGALVGLTAIVVVCGVLFVVGGFFHDLLPDDEHSISAESVKSVKINGFEATGQDGEGTKYFIGPQSADVVGELEGPGFVEDDSRKARGEDSVFLWVGGGTMKGSTGRTCGVYVKQLRPGKLPLSYHRASPDQAAEVRNGSKVLIEVSLTCE
ncbi:hypothetical protein Lfu02_63910 [Longispora fulva]|nr:hypothetical protein Lfu02_63910 [Longispora fulva]